MPVERPSEIGVESPHILSEKGLFEFLPIVRSVATPRELKRLVLRLVLYFRQSAVAINPRDMITLLLIKLKFPDIYYTISKNEYILTHPWWARKRGRGTRPAIGAVANCDELVEKSQRLRQGMLEGLEVQDRGLAEELMMILFSGLPRVAGGPDQAPSILWNDDLERLAFRERRLVHPSHFRKYFHKSTVFGTSYSRYSKIFLSNFRYDNEHISESGVAWELQRWADAGGLESFARCWKIWPPSWRKGEGTLPGMALVTSLSALPAAGRSWQKCPQRRPAT